MSSGRCGWEDSVLEWQVLIFPSALKWQTENPLSPSVCAFPACRQWKYDSEMLARYRQALETAVNISAKHSLPPLPGRTLLVYLTDADADKLCPKSNPQGVKKIFLKCGVNRMMGLLRSILFTDLVLTCFYSLLPLYIRVLNLGRDPGFSPLPSPTALPEDCRSSPLRTWGFCPFPQAGKCLAFRAG